MTCCRVRGPLSVLMGRARIITGRTREDQDGDSNVPRLQLTLLFFPLLRHTSGTSCDFSKINWRMCPCRVLLSSFADSSHIDPGVFASRGPPARSLITHTCTLRSVSWPWSGKDVGARPRGQSPLTGARSVLDRLIRYNLQPSYIYQGWPISRSRLTRQELKMSEI